VRACDRLAVPGAAADGAAPLRSDPEQITHSEGPVPATLPAPGLRRAQRPESSSPRTEGASFATPEPSPTQRSDAGRYCPCGAWLVLHVRKLLPLGVRRVAPTPRTE